MYHEELLTNLINPAVQKRHLYKPMNHTKLKIGDIVLLKDKFVKATSYPMGVVKAVDENDLGEVTAAVILKRATREKVYRHVTSLILLLPAECTYSDSYKPELPLPIQADSNGNRPRALREAAVISRQRTKVLINHNSV